MSNTKKKFYLLIGVLTFLAGLYFTYNETTITDSNRDGIVHPKGSTMNIKPILQIIPSHAPQWVFKTIIKHF